MLRDGGYRTSMIGKWDLGHFAEQMWPTNRGFDTYLGLTCRGLSSYFTYDNGGYNDIHRGMSAGSACCLAPEFSVGVMSSELKQSLSVRAHPL